MSSGRRSLVLLALVALTVVGWPSSVLAQTNAPPPQYCPESATIEAGQDSLVTVQVTQGDVVSNDITIEFADGIEIKQALSVPGWTAQTSGPRTVRYSGGQPEPNTCVGFPIMVNGTRRGAFAARAFQKLPTGEFVERPAQNEILLNPDGTSVVVDYLGPPNPAFEQVIYVTGGDSGGLLESPLVPIAIAIVVIAVAALVIRKWTPKKKEPSSAS